MKTKYAPGCWNLVDKDGEEYRLLVERDEFSDSPIEDGCLFSKIHTWSRRYDLNCGTDANETSYDILANLCREHTTLSEDELDEMSEKQMIEVLQKSDSIVIQYISLHEHSGISLGLQSDTILSDPFDTSIIGFAYIEKSDMAYMQSSWKEEAIHHMRREIRMLDNYYGGEVYIATIEKRVHIRDEKTCSHCGEVIEVNEYDTWEEVEVSFGYYGYDMEENGIVDLVHEYYMCFADEEPEETRQAKLA